MMAARKLAWLFAVGCCCLAASLWAQDFNVTGHVVLEGAAHISPATSTVVWLAPIAGDPNGAVTVTPMHAVLRQKNKAFEPHMLVVTKGSTVEFPNLDPWIHHVFSLFHATSFDL